MPADLARIAIARDLLAQLGVTLADLHDAGTPASTVPTLADYLPCVIASTGPGANRTYGSYWIRMAAAWGTRPLDQISASDIQAMQHRMATTARSRGNSRHGRHAGEHVITAARAIYNRAIADGHISPGASPAHRVAKPRRLPNTRRALTAHELDQINTTARTSGNDVVLDALLLRLHTETACRRGGALGLRLADLDTDNCLVQLREKGSTEGPPIFRTANPLGFPFRKRGHTCQRTAGRSLLNTRMKPRRWWSSYPDRSPRSRGSVDSTSKPYVTG